MYPKFYVFFPNFTPPTQCLFVIRPKLLFLLFVNDMPLYINDAYLDMCADDLSLYTASKKLETVKETFQKGLGEEPNKLSCFRSDPIMFMYITIL